MPLLISFKLLKIPLLDYWNHSINSPIFTFTFYSPGCCHSDIFNIQSNHDTCLYLHHPSFDRILYTQFRMIFSSVQLSHSVVSNCLPPHELQHASPPCPSPTPGVHPNPCPLSRWCHPTISSSVIPSPPALNLSQHQGLSSESVLFMRWPNYWSFRINISLSNEHPGQISFKMDWLDLLAVQGTLRSLLQHHSSKASILLCSVFFIVQLSHPYMTTGKTIALTTRTFVGKIMSLLFNMLSSLVITFLSRSKHLLISWLQPQSAVILEPKKHKVRHCFCIYLTWSDGTGCHDLTFLNVEL